MKRCRSPPIAAVVAAALALAFSVAHATSFGSPDWCQLAYDDCQLRFERETQVPYFTLDAPANMPYSPQIISRHAHERIGLCHSGAVWPQFIESGYNVRPFNFSPSANYSRTQFKPFALPFQIGSAIGHESFHGHKPALGSCVRVYISSYQLLIGEQPPQVRNIELSRDEAIRQRKCVVFRTT